ncbi:MAG: hypothetical protein IT423_09295 [Pirellulaceae bacterium]|nr:hypothetical protein [Pirellulaceae bacterium]
MPENMPEKRRPDHYQLPNQEPGPPIDPPRLVRPLASHKRSAHRGNRQSYRVSDEMNQLLLKIDELYVKLRLVWKALFFEAARNELLGTGPVEKIYSVPRRFDLATLFVVSNAFALLFALLAFIGYDSLTKLLWFAYISGVGVSQAVLYAGRAPRLSSVVSGGVLLAILGAPVSEDLDFGSIFSPLMMLIFGLPIGYLSGAVIGGVFLIADKLRNYWDSRLSTAVA